MSANRSGRELKPGASQGETMETALTIKDVAKRLQMAASTIYKYTEKGKIPSHKVGNCVRISELELEQYFQSCKTKKQIREDSK